MRDGWHYSGSYTVDGHRVAWVTLHDGFWWGHLASGGKVDYFPTRREARAWCERQLGEAVSTAEKEK